MSLCVLKDTTESLNIVLAGAVTTNQATFTCSYADKTATAFTPGSNFDDTNNTTEVVCAAAPAAASTQRIVESVHVYNADTVAITARLIHKDSDGTDRIFRSQEIAAGKDYVFSSKIVSDTSLIHASDFHTDIISGLNALAAMPDLTDELMISDAGIPKRIDFDVLMRQPSFLAYLGTNQTGIANDTPTRVLLDTEDWDTESEFASYRHTPLTAGKYLYWGNTYWSDMDDGKQYGALLYKNGVAGTRFGYQVALSSATAQNVLIGAFGVIDMNGSTDYVELFGWHSNGDATPAIVADRSGTFLFGIRLSTSKDA